MKINEFIFEGGHAIKGSRKIQKEDIDKTLDWISNVSGLSKDYLRGHILGSGGKVSYSGDLDIAIDPKAHNLDDMAERLKQFGIDVKVSRNFKIVSFGAPIKGNVENGIVQTDFMFGPTEWLKFSYFSPGYKSNYKGLYRTMLLQAVALSKTTFTKNDDSGELIAKIGTVLDLGSGLSMQYRLKPKKKKGLGYTKTFKQVSPEEFKVEYPDSSGELINIIKPDDAARYLFGSGIRAKDLESFEQVLQLVLKMPVTKRKLIEKIYYRRSGFMFDETPTIGK